MKVQFYSFLACCSKVLLLGRRAGFQCSFFAQIAQKRISSKKDVFFDGSQNGSNIHYGVFFDFRLFRVLFKKICSFVDVLVSRAPRFSPNSPKNNCFQKRVFDESQNGSNNLYSVSFDFPFLRCGSKGFALCGSACLDFSVCS